MQYIELNRLMYAHVGRHFGCCLGDTLASELGILSTHPPILLTTLRPVPPGTNGGLSLAGKCNHLPMTIQHASMAMSEATPVRLYCHFFGLTPGHFPRTIQCVD